MLYTKSKDFMKNMIKYLDMSMNVRTFAVQQVDELNHLAGQAINLLNCLLGIFYVQILRYWRLPIRKLRLAFRGEVHQLVAAYMATAFFMFAIYNLMQQVMADLFNVKTMSSLQIAELTGKTHSNVMRDIRNILEQLDDRGAFNFELTSYVDKSNRESPCYKLTKKDCLLLASGYDANLRAKIINRWEELETRELSRKELALMVIQAEEDKERLALEVHQKQETIELQQKEIALAAPKVQYVDTVLKSVNTYATNLIAKEMGMSAETLNKRLKEKGIQYRQSGVWVLTSRYQDKGYTKTRTHTYTRSDGSQSTAMLTVWTEQGREFLHSLFKA